RLVPLGPCPRPSQGDGGLEPARADVVEPLGPPCVLEEALSEHARILCVGIAADGLHLPGHGGVADERVESLGLRARHAHPHPDELVLLALAPWALAVAEGAVTIARSRRVHVRVSGPPDVQHVLGAASIPGALDALEERVRELRR